MTPEAAPPRAVGVVGLGLIGASLCRALRDRLPRTRIAAVARRAETARRALDDGICDAAATDASVLEDVEVVVLCTPVDAMPAWMERARHAGGGTALVTDAGSTKAWVMERGAAVLGADRFVGGHPMAGRERSGYDAAEAGLFEGCVWVLTPAADAALERAAPWAAALRALGATVEVMEAAEHDRAVAWISHLPFALSAALVRAAAAAPEWPAAARLAAGGFRDMARLAGGDPAMYAAITATNAAAMGEALAGLEAELARLRTLLAGADADAAAEHFASARDLRRAWLDGREAAGRAVPPA